MERREFLKILPITAAAAMASCKPPTEEIVPAVEPVEYQLPGKEYYYSSAYCSGMSVYGIKVKMIDGRPVKIDGNDFHPANKGKSSAELQASLFSLYDPERFRQPTINGKEAAIDDCYDSVSEKISEALDSGNKVHICLPPVLSTSLEKLISMISGISGNIKFYSIFPPDSIYFKLQNIYKSHIPVPRLSKYNSVISINNDFLGFSDYSLLYSREFFERKTRRDLDIIISKPMITNYPNHYKSIFSQHKIEEDISSILSIYLSGINKSKIILFDGNLSETPIRKIIKVNEENPEYSNSYWIKKSENIIPSGLDEINPEKGDLVLFLDCEQSRYWPFETDRIVDTVGEDNAVNLSLYADKINGYGVEIPASHYLESWGDFNNIDGSVTIRQPVISPINENSGNAEDLLINCFAGLLEEIPGDWYDFIRENFGETAGDTSWEQALRKGFYFPADFDRSKVDFSKTDESDDTEEAADTEFNIEICRSVNSSGYDNPVLAEIPDPISGMVYKQAVMIPDNIAKKYKCKSGDMLEIQTRNQKNEIINGNFNCIVSYEVADDTIVFIDNGVYSPVGQNPWAYKLNKDIKISFETKGKAESQSPDIKISKNSFEKFNIDDEKPDINREVEYLGQKWGMAIDLEKCTGCSACVAACRIENNIPPVGPEEAEKGRLLNWITILTTNDTLARYQIPLICQHCDNAPCEAVCPVHASVHSPEGLNETVYNRCVGTRYCMANCPYKVRRFNYYPYRENIQKPAELMFNPNVTVRSRGIVEKCSFCVQRLNQAGRKYKQQGIKQIPDGGVKTACQEACPTSAIIFGNLNDPDSEISKAIHSGRTYRLLGDLNTKPSVYYLGGMDFEFDF